MIGRKLLWIREVSDGDALGVGGPGGGGPVVGWQANLLGVELVAMSVSGSGPADWLEQVLSAGRPDGLVADVALPRLWPMLGSAGQGSLAVYWPVRVEEDLHAIRHLRAWREAHPGRVGLLYEPVVELGGFPAAGTQARVHARVVQRSFQAAGGAEQACLSAARQACSAGRSGFTHVWAGGQAGEAAGRAEEPSCLAVTLWRSAGQIEQWALVGAEGVRVPGSDGAGVAVLGPSEDATADFLAMMLASAVLRSARLGDAVAIPAH